MKKSVKFLDQATASSSIESKGNKNSSKDLSKHKQKVERLNATIDKIAKQRTKNNRKEFAETAEEIVKFRKRKSAVRFNIQPKQKVMDSKKQNKTESRKRQGSGWWSVKDLVSSRWNGNTKEYLVRWEGQYVQNLLITIFNSIGF